jgi:hypothetical protein
MFAFHRSPDASFSTNPTDVTNHEYRGFAARKIGLAADFASDVNPGELTFEEGTSQLGDHTVSNVNLR